ncbi:hypothetical protein RNJ44_00786 [Nakaseomyces bracarensis]|uniref:Alpha-1,3-mannosyltransferase n=1 Tax=Nakaseomyces bracarensis TaxID=273131 RepID=A0ABR4NSG0_9SACH
MVRVNPHHKKIIPLLLAVLAISSLVIINIHSNNFIKQATEIEISSSEESEDIYDLHDAEKYFEYFKPAGEHSIYAYLSDGMKRNQFGKYTSSEAYKQWKKMNKKQEKILSHWDSSSLNDRCKLLVKAMYFGKEDWHSKRIRDRFNDKEDGQKHFQNTIERLRIYNKCFIEGGVGSNKFFRELKEEFGVNVTASDVQARMFPFLKTATEDSKEYMYPNITDMRTRMSISEPHTKVPFDEFNSNFLHFWRKNSKGKGIITTLGKHQLFMLRKQLYVWKELNNDIPIQITYKANELGEKEREEIAKVATETGQDVTLINLDPILDKEEATRKINRFDNKYLAFLFNTFEEFIFVDVDVVSFVPPMTYFNMESYKSSGLRFWRDRRGINNSHNKNCNGILMGIEPSFEEHIMLGSNMNLKPSDPRIKKSSSRQAMILREYFIDNVLHHVESGLVVANKVDKFISFIAAFYLNIYSDFSWCSYGDKETLWMGPLIMGMDFFVDKKGAAAVGKIKDSKTGKGEDVKTVCSTQMAHLDENRNILWVNGGLRVCKFDDGAREDFKNHPDYFTSKVGTTENLDKLYKSPLEIDGFVIPEMGDLGWKKGNECKSYSYCASARVNSTDSESYIGILDPEAKARINNYVQVYHAA